MARTDLAAQLITQAGLAPAYEAANADGNMFTFGGREYLHVKKGSAAPVTVTIVTPVTVSGRAVPDDTVSVPAGGERLIGDLDPEVHVWQSGADRNKVHVDYSAVASVTVGVFRLA